MFSAVTLSRSPPRADTTMMATLDRSRICLHSSNPSTSGSIRSSSTMSGSSVSSSVSALLPSNDTSVSKPRTARFDLIRSTMFGSSSTMSTRVGMAGSVTCRHSTGWCRRRRLARGLAGRSANGHGHRLFYWQRNEEAGAALRRLKLKAAAVRRPDPAGDGQPEPRARPAPPRPGDAGGEHVVPARVALDGGLGDGPGQFRRESLAVVGDPHGHRAGTVGGGGDHHLRPRRVVTERVSDEVDEHLLKPVVVGPDGGQPGRFGDSDLG